MYEMSLTYDDAFKYSDIFNPISANTLLRAGKLAQLEAKKIIIDLGSGKGFPSLLWASLFGVQIEGYDLGERFVEYANSRAKMLNLSHQVKYFSKDVKALRGKREYDVVASLGLGIVPVYGTTRDGLNYFQTLLRKDGFVIIAEPIWLVKPIPTEVLNQLGIAENHFLTKTEFQKLIEELGFQAKGNFTSSKEDWELYITPVNRALCEIVESGGELAEEAKHMMNSFKAEYDAVGKYWNMALWVLQT